MANNINDKIEDYNVDYRTSKNINDYNKNRTTKSVVAVAPRSQNKGIGKKIEIEEKEIKTKTNNNYDNKTKTNKVKKKTTKFLKLKLCIMLSIALAGVLIINLFYNGSIKMGGIKVPRGETENYSKFIMPVVMQDPECFENINEANPKMVLESSLWYSILTQKDDEYIDVDNRGRTLIPLKNVESSCKKLFGSNSQLKEEAFNINTFFEFDKEDQKFHVSPCSSYGKYSPYIIEATKKGGSVLLEVEYILLNDDKTGDESEKTKKYKEYILNTDLQTENYYIDSVKDSKLHH